MDKKILIIAKPDVEAKLHAWQDNIAAIRRLSRHTLRNYSHDLTEFLRFVAEHIGHPPSLDDLSKLKITDFRSWLSRLSQDELTARSRARSLSSVRSFFHWLDNTGTLHNPAISLIRTPRIHKTLPRPISEDEAQKMMGDTSLFRNDWQGVRDRSLFFLLYGGGLRINEALSLNHGDIAGMHDSIKVTGKGNKQRIVPILESVRQMIEMYVSCCPFPTDKNCPVFYGARGKRLNQGVAQREMRFIRHQLGLPDTVTPHALRHSFATHILRHGGNIREIQELLGHASLSSTQKYTELNIEDLRETVEHFHPRH